MALPTSYATEIEFATWMHGILGQTANMSGYLKWSAPGEDTGKYADAVNEAIAIYGAADITAVTNVHLLHQIGRVELWRMVAERTVAYHDYRALDDNAENKRSQIHKQAKALMESALKRMPKGYYSNSSVPFGSQTVDNAVVW
jgi:SAM-dependent MidA family methyltransferase